jgi:GH43 family beta-xylosidase
MIYHKAFRGLAAVVLLLAPAAQTALAACFTDPMMQGQDPEVAYKDGVFRLVQSDGCNIHLKESYTPGGLATASDQIILSVGCNNVWAPEIHWFNNHWYLYYSPDFGSGHRVYAAESQGTNATGPYTVRGVLYDGFWNIDGSVFATTNGQLYYICSGSPSGTQNLYIAPMSNPYTLSGAPVLISQPTLAWETHGAPPAVNEGPYGFVHYGGVFIVYSASGCWTDDYELGLLTLTGTNLLDPTAWTKSGPVFTKQTGAYGPGHNGVFTDASGQWWNIYHANNLSGQGCGGNRQLRLQRIFWNANNVPDFGSPVPIGSLISDDSDFLAARFPLTETNGTLASGTVCSQTASLAGGAAWANPGIKLNGTSSYVDCGAAVGNDVQNAVTLAAWIKPDAFVDWASVITKGSNSAPYAMQVWHDGALRFTANWGPPPGGVGGGSWNSNTKLTTNQWHHVAVTYDGLNARFYLDGALDSYQPALTLRFGVVSESLIIGADFPGGDEYFNGTIRDARVYGRALNGSEIAVLATPNHAPAFAPIASSSMVARQNLVVHNTATDTDSPPQTVTFKIVQAPAGATINSSSGVFAWRPALSQAPSTNLIMLSASDNGVPPLSSTQSFTVTVRPPVPPVLGPPASSNSMLVFDVSGDLGPDYVMWSSTNLQDWSSVLITNPPVTPFRIMVPLDPAAAANFYRFQVQ